MNSFEELVFTDSDAQVLWYISHQISGFETLASIQNNGYKIKEAPRE